MNCGLIGGALVCVCGYGPRKGEVYGGRAAYDPHATPCGWAEFRAHSTFSNDQAPMQLIESAPKSEWGGWISRVEQTRGGGWLACIMSVPNGLPGRILGVCVTGGSLSYPSKELALAEAARLLAQ